MIKWGIVGLGRMAKTFANAIKEVVKADNAGIKVKLIISYINFKKDLILSQKIHLKI